MVGVILRSSHKGSYELSKVVLMLLLWALGFGLLTIVMIESYLWTFRIAHMVMEVMETCLKFGDC